MQRTRRPGWRLTTPTAGVLDERGVLLRAAQARGRRPRPRSRSGGDAGRGAVVEIYSDAARRAIALFLTGPAAGRDPRLKAALAEVLKLQEQLGKLEEELGRLRERRTPTASARSRCART